MTLGILYHMPFWQTADGGLWEAEGSFARYVDSLAPYFDEVILSVPVFDTAAGVGFARAGGECHAGAAAVLPGPAPVYPMLRDPSRLRPWVDQCDVIHLRVPSPAAIFAFRIAEAKRKPVFLLVVGDYEALLPHLGYRGIKKFLFGPYVGIRGMGASLHDPPGTDVRQWRRASRQARAPWRARQRDQDDDAAASDLSTRTDTCTGPAIRLLCVSRIDPRKGLRSLPRWWRPHRRGHDATLDIVGPTIGLIGESERDAIVAEAKAPGVGDRVNLRGPVALDRLLPLYRDYDLFVLPTRPGEGIPRVLLEAMAAGLPIVTTRVSPASRSLIAHEENGLLVDEGSPISW